MENEQQDVIMPQEMAMEIGILHMRIQKLKLALAQAKQQLREAIAQASAPTEVETEQE